VEQQGNKMTLRNTILSTVAALLLAASVGCAQEAQAPIQAKEVKNGVLITNISDGPVTINAVAFNDRPECYAGPVVAMTEAEREEAGKQWRDSLDPKQWNTQKELTRKNDPIWRAENERNALPVQLLRGQQHIITAMCSRDFGKLLNATVETTQGSYSWSWK
jgi:hypothetical protein